MIIANMKLNDNTPLRLVGVETDDRDYKLIVDAVGADGKTIVSGATEDMEIIKLFRSMIKFKYVCVGIPKSLDGKPFCPACDDIESGLFEIMSEVGLATSSDLAILAPHSYYDLESFCRPMIDINYKTKRVG